MAQWDTYTPGLHRLADDVWAYLQPDGSWGWNNTALLATAREALLIDTTIDLRTTQRMLGQMRAESPAAAQISKVILTHWHVDHVHGVSADELANSEIIASTTCAQYMAKMPPATWLLAIEALEGDAKKQMGHLLNDQFDFSGLRYVQPTRTFDGTLDITVDGRLVQVIEAGPCHTRSDSIVHLPHAGVVHMGDLVRARHHVGLQFPFMSNLLDICGRAYALDARVYVPGHGPLMERTDLKAVIDYLNFLQSEAKRRYDAGLPLLDAFDDLMMNLGEYSHYTGTDGLFFTLKMMYCEFAGDSSDFARRDYPEYLATQWRLRTSLRSRFPQLFGR